MFIYPYIIAKWYKFGFSRLFDNLSLEINNRLTRDDAINIIRQNGNQVPKQEINSLRNLFG